jgi:AraC family transcriptional regulator, regulatory protein of adaptative response / methylated-DNA-[protein]-cysteine methyltransferase
MICDHCHGRHLVLREGRARPCEECGGLGVLHCCEGLPAQPEAPAGATPIRYTLLACPLGRLLLAATPRGICAVYLGDADADLEARLRREYPEAEVRRDDAGLSPWSDELLRHLDGRQPHLDLPLDVQATAFQWRVWQALRAIPYGSTRSYGEIARAIGQPAAARAVARACATNPVAVLIPCHRVVREDGGLGGYYWGVERKQALLDREKNAARPDSPPNPASEKPRRPDPHPTPGRHTVICPAESR